MVKSRHALDHAFYALANPTRRAILSRLAKGRRTVGDLAKPFEISPSGFSKHLRVLERVGLLRQHKRGRERYCEVVVEPLEKAATWLEAYRETWKASLDSFAGYAEELQSTRSRKGKR